ncbi:MAG TPA: hypothetical protein VNV63_00915 [Nitrospiria bacterium]|jgi:hypothetical protein|nr:hypothetical protein [Nitrospiria bacterium]
MMNDDDDELKEGLKKSMEEPAKKKDDDAYGTFVRNQMEKMAPSGWLAQRKKDYEGPHGNEEV